MCVSECHDPGFISEAVIKCSEKKATQERIGVLQLTFLVTVHHCREAKTGTSSS